MRPTSAIVFLLCALLRPYAASASPIIITSGAVGVYWDADTGSAQLISASSRFNSEQHASPQIGGFYGGVVANLRGVVGLGNAGHYPFDQLYEGTLYEDVWLAGLLSFDAPFYVPAGLASEGVYVTFPVPFTTVGSIRGYSDSSLSGTPLFSADLSGSGVASATFREFGDDDFYLLARFGGISYTFSPAEVATPEPSTILLLLTGGLGMALRGRRRRTVSVKPRT
jgi:hypothetical protein